MRRWENAKRMTAAALLAGLLGGLTGSAVKLVGEVIYPPRPPAHEPPPALLAEKVAGHPLTDSQKKIATQIFHWSLGGGIGAAYAVAAEFVPAVTAGYGSLFGVAILLGTHESVLPLLGLTEPPAKQPFREQSSELLTHLMYGISTEVVRRFLMKRWRSGSPS